MKCPIDQTTLKEVVYEGIHIETCPSCGGEWLDADELKHVVAAREHKFSEAELAALAKAKPVTGIALESVDRDVPCPKCGTQTKPVNYGGDTGLIIDSCPDCGGIWLDAAEVESIQGIVEAWEKQLPEDIKSYRDLLDKIEKDAGPEDVKYSWAPPINMLVNGIVDRFIV